MDSSPPSTSPRGHPNLLLQIRTLVSWCTNNGIVIDGRLQIQPENAAPGVTVFSSEEFIPSSVTLVKIPKSSVLSVKSSSVASMINTISYGLEAQLELALALYLEIAKGESSKWYGYLQSLPYKVDLPVFWDFESEDVDVYTDGRAALNWLEGTEVHKRLRLSTEGKESVLSIINSFYEDKIAPILSKCFGTFPKPQLDEFYHAYSLVSSRAFLVDAYHGLSMVPIADAFNHTTDNHVHLESEFEVCPECGSLRECPHDQDSCDTNLLQSGSSTDTIEEDNCYEMVSNCAIAPHSEVFNTYGETLSNAQLLVQYGFILDVNENDRITWSLEEVYQNVVQMLGEVDVLPTTLTLDLIRALWSQAGKRSDVQFTGGESELLYYCDSNWSTTLTNGNTDSSDTFCINSDGKVSRQLWIFCALFQVFVISSKIHDSSFEADAQYREEAAVVVLDLINQMITAQQRIEADMEIQNEEMELDDESPANSEIESENIRNLLSETASTILLLCHQRLSEIGPKDMDISTIDLGNMLDDLPNDRPRTRLAITHIMTEMSILNTCIGTWSEFPRTQTVHLLELGPVHIRIGPYAVYCQSFKASHSFQLS
ncbi:SET domain-containing protein [Dendrothele bispora CBS 962.96]|uniref:SET domain-containing protein n=1 Tax=Dendrothele bispora (strain CBS 962.96) TaxID=1314807 RepID=A0A4S8M928_DENBC|nr:SET domain-containing protein [Dendrothele bispora CBS 962.96]